MNSEVCGGAAAEAAEDAVAKDAVHSAMRVRQSAKSMV